MGNPAVIVWMFVSLAVCLALLVVPFVLMQRKGLRIGRAFWVGALAFFVSQVVLRIPLLNLLAQTFFYQTLSLNPVLNGLFLGVTAGLFEECARFFACKWLLKRHRRYVDAVAFGFGHGGIEAVLLVGASIASSLVLLFAMYNGTLESLVGAQADVVAAQLAAVTPLLAALGGVERVLAVCIHLGLSVMVFAGFVRKQPWRYLVLAILLHAAVDATVVILPAYVDLGALELEAVVAVFSAALLIYAMKARRAFTLEETQDDAPQTQEGETT